MNLIEMLRVSGLNPILVDEDTFKEKPVQVNSFALFHELIERGIRSGLNKAADSDLDYVRFEDKNEELAVEKIAEYVLNEICEFFNWEDEYGDDRGTPHSSDLAVGGLRARVASIERSLVTIERRLQQRGGVVHNHEVEE